MDKKAAFVFLISIIVFSLLFFLYNKKTSTSPAPTYTFAQSVKACNTTPTQERFSCYRKAIDTYYKENHQGFLAALKDEGKNLSFNVDGGKADLTYAIFGTNCHTFYHAVGDFMATYSTDDVATLVEGGPIHCTNGYTMGVYKRLALKNHFSTDLLKKFWEVCKKGAENQCAHEIGHILHDKYSYSVLSVLDDISAKQYTLGYPESYMYTLSPNGDAKADTDKPFEECRQLMPDKNKLAQCYTGIGHNLFLFGEFAKDGYKGVFSQCRQSTGTNRDDCYAFLIYRIGINEAATRFLSHRFEEGRKVCDDVGFKEHCYRGIGGGIGLFVDSEYALTDINEKNLAGVKKELFDYLMLCEESERKYIESCFAGLFGTKFAKFYDLLKIYYEPIEKLRPSWDSDFEVVG